MGNFLAIVYFGIAGLLALYGLNCYLMTYLMWRKRKSACSFRHRVRTTSAISSYGGILPAVVTQLPIYNEFNVVERLIEAACRINYPQDLYSVQVLDDSTDETCELIDSVVKKMQLQGCSVTVLRRADRIGYKAGALRHGMERSVAELYAVFDADFIPEPDFLEQVIPFFLDNSDLGLAQARWGHLNRKASFLTRAQAVGMDGHFMIEQAARNWNNLYMNFNGTAGVWRGKSILDAGGWSWDTLTEDMDLSYRIQMEGWQTVYLPDVIVPAEIPEDINAFKSQQFRWAKGSIQTAIKLLPTVLRQKTSMFKKLQAVLHMTHYMVHPMMLALSILALPVLIMFELNISNESFTFLAVLLFGAMTAPSTLYVVSQKAGYRDWKRRILILPGLVVMGVGLAVSNTRAVYQALAGIESGFVRTPKKGDVHRKQYHVGSLYIGLIEIGVGLYCGISLQVYISEAKYLVGPFLAIYCAGYLFVGILTLLHGVGIEKMVSIFQKIPVEKGVKQ